MNRQPRKNHDLSNHAWLIEHARHAFDAGVTRDVEWRLDQLARLREGVTRCSNRILTALFADLGRGHYESHLSEIDLVVAEIDHVRRRLRSWLKPRSRPMTVPLLPARGWLIYEPLGVALILGPWNYPFLLTFLPLIGAIAAGNAAIVKPSERAAHSADVMENIVSEYLDTRAFAVVQGGARCAEALLELRFDHIFFTGSESVGRHVLRAAAEHTTPVTLELGGKSPVFVDGTTALRQTARRIVWGKILNAGQTCMAPDYLLVTRSHTYPLVRELRAAIRDFYGEDPRASLDYGRIVDERHFDRLVALLESGTVLHGGRVDRRALYIEPTLSDGSDRDSLIMRDEVFGPILPIVEVNDGNHAREIVRSLPKALAIYLFTSDKRERSQWIDETSSGAIALGATVAHSSIPSLPFGGVGSSGMGRYHGIHSLRTFSNEKAVFSKPVRPDTMAVIYPPSSALKRHVVRLLAEMAPLRLRRRAGHSPSPSRPPPD